MGTSILRRALRSISDGTLPFKVLNRVCKTQYVPSPEVGMDRYGAQHYPRAGWKSLSTAAKQAWVRFSPLIEKYRVQTVVYVGANTGKTVLALDEAFPKLEFYLIEPAPETFSELVRNTVNRSNMHCIKLAAGSEDDWSDMLVDNFSPASSLLRYEQIALKEFPFLGNQVTVKVQGKRLDDILADCKVTDADLLIIDVQGFEDYVLQGASYTLSSCKVVIIELSLQSLYRGSSTFDSVYQVLVSQGFCLRHVLNPVQGISHQILQIDGAFVREN